MHLLDYSRDIWGRGFRVVLVDSRRCGGIIMTFILPSRYFIAHSLDTHVMEILYSRELSTIAKLRELLYYSNSEKLSQVGTPTYKFVCKRTSDENRPGTPSVLLRHDLRCGLP
jgi:hypothetical protein